MAIPDTIDGFTKTYTAKKDGWMGVWHPIAAGIGDPDREDVTIGEVYGDTGAITADLWHPERLDESYKATFADAADAAQWVVNEYERRTAESDWR